MQEKTSRRNFLKYSTLAGLGIAVNPLSANSKDEKMTEVDNQIKLKKGQQIVSLLQTTDVHCQLHPHDELFWENEKAVFRKAEATHTWALTSTQLEKEIQTLL